MSPLGFTDDEMDSLTTLASALPPAARDGFLQTVAAKLSAYPPEARGPGLVLATEAQRDFVNGVARSKPANYPYHTDVIPIEPKAVVAMPFRSSR
jgi:hypothetical protein